MHAHTYPVDKLSLQKFNNLNNNEDENKTKKSKRGDNIIK